VSDQSGWGAADEPTVAVPSVGGDGDPPTEVHRAVPAGGDEPPSERPWWIAIVAVLVVIVLLLLGILLLGGDDDDEDDGDTTTTTELVDESTTTSSSSTSTTSTSTSTTSTTAPPTTTTAPATTTTAPSTAPSVTSIDASEFTCPGDLTLSWTTTNATSVEVAIDNPGGVFDTGPANGSMSVPAPCGGDSQTYFVTAIAGNGDRITQQLQVESP
jgi:hypothetical protein